MPQRLPVSFKKVSTKIETETRAILKVQADISLSTTLDAFYLFPGNAVKTVKSKPLRSVHLASYL